MTESIPRCLSRWISCQATHEAVGKQNVAWTQQIPQPAQHPQLAVALAGIAADSQVEYGSAGKRKEGRDACQRKTKSGLLLRRLRIGLLVIRGIWHRYGRAVVGQDAATFPKPLVLCSVAIALFLKPAVQAVRLGRSLPAQLMEAFGPAEPQRAPFSVRAAIFASAPEPVPIETLEYSNGLKLDLYRATGRSRAPCVVVIHGGSWVCGNRMDFGTRRELNDWLSRQGYAVASIDSESR